MKTCMTLWAASVGEEDVYVLPFELVWYEGWGMGGERGVLENKKIPGIKLNEYQNATVFRTHMYLPGLTHGTQYQKHGYGRMYHKQVLLNVSLSSPRL